MSSLCFPAFTRAEAPQRHQPAEGFLDPHRQEGVAALRLLRTRPLAHHQIPQSCQGKQPLLNFIAGGLLKVQFTVILVKIRYLHLSSQEIKHCHK